MNHMYSDSKKYFYLKSNVSYKGFVVNHITNVIKEFDSFCIVIVNTEEKFNVKDINISEYFNSYNCNNNIEKLYNEKGDKQIINIYCPKDVSVDMFLDSLVGREVSSVIVVTNKPTDEQLKLFNYAKTRIRGKCNV
jgi:hypothetical protein